MNRETKLDIIEYIAVFLIATVLVALGSVGTLYLQYNSQQDNIDESKNIESLQQIVNECSELDLETTAKCLRDNIKVIYNYKSLKDRNLTKNTNRTFEDIKENGGNCYDYTHLYIQLANELGFNNTFISQTGVSEVVSAHRYFIMWNETNYCEIDQTELKCKEIII
jgi:hypothetical protein